MENRAVAQPTDFELRSEVPARTVSLEFSGRFQQQSVVWKGRFLALSNGGQKHRPYIEIEVRQGEYLIEVGLPVAIIDLPTVRKAVIMVRNYKRLRPGRHEFGSHH